MNKTAAFVAAIMLTCLAPAGLAAAEADAPMRWTLYELTDQRGAAHHATVHNQRPALVMLSRYAEPRSTGKFQYEGVLLGVSLDCAAMRFQPYRSVLYAGDGGVVGEEHKPAPSKPFTKAHSRTY